MPVYPNRLYQQGLTSRRKLSKNEELEKTAAEMRARATARAQPKRGNGLTEHGMTLAALRYDPQAS